MSASGTGPSPGEARARLARLAWLLDSSIPLPGTRLSIGLDALIGLIPGIGDLVGVALSSWILKEAHALGASRAVLLRMAANVALEGLAGLVPVAGDVFDAFYKANVRNVKLLGEWMDRPERAERSSRAFVGTLAAGLLVVVALAAALLLAVLLWLRGLAA